MPATQIAIEDAGATGTEGTLTLEAAKTFAPRNLGKLEEIKRLLPSFGWEVVQGWCPVHQRVIEGAHDHDGRLCHLRIFVRYKNYPTVRGMMPSLDRLLELLRRGGVAELDEPGSRKAYGNALVKPAQRRRSSGSSLVW